MARHCRSCDVCKRTLHKRQVPNAPLGQIPLIDTLLQRVVIDLFPISEKIETF